MPKILTEAQVEQFRRDGCVFPIRVMPEDQALEIRRKLEDYEKQIRRATGRVTCGTRRICCFLGSLTWCAISRIVDAIEDLYGPESAVLDHQLFHQGSKQSGVRFVAPGLDLLGTQQARRRDRVGCIDAEQSCQRRDDVHSRHAHVGSTRASRYVRQEQSVDAWAGSRGRCRRVEGGDDRAATGRDFAASRAVGAWLAGQSIE